MRLINKEIIEKPSEQEILFLCAVQKVKSLHLTDHAHLR